MTAWFVSPQCGKEFGGLANVGRRKEANMAVTGRGSLSGQRTEDCGVKNLGVSEW